MPIFNALSRDADDMTALIGRMSSSDPNLAHLAAVSVTFLNGLTAEAVRRCRGRYDADAQQLLDSTQRRFVVALEGFVRVVDASPRTAVGNHSRAMLLERLWLTHNVVDIAINAASQHEMGFGALAEAGFTFDHLRL